MPKTTAVESHDEHANTLGERVAAYRRLRGMSMRFLAAGAGVSPSFLSQLERGLSNATINTTRRIAAALGVSLADLVDGEIKYTRGVVRAIDRPLYSADLGCVKHVVSQAPRSSTEIYQGTLEPGGATGISPLSHDHAQEFLIVLRGTVRVTVGPDVYDMYRNDSLEYFSSVPHLVQNVSDEAAEVLWVTDVPNAVVARSVTS
ncbi:helix-turn-helix domain-containing protein [Mycolicibacterium komossense]|uniref:Helix-turn-helix domain-containing protein n=1 Tax=Mycolicibacterium komossense TaxID=1779 RepID=A0ABT3CJ04_9MYCO|nr:cupin domain-containing protein [Mycolicibacterium komossense]MCV7229435.1 helix-turn-helix domain-containing protein [Mycolicibacterium komossense]